MDSFRDTGLDASKNSPVATCHNMSQVSHENFHVISAPSLAGHESSPTNAFKKRRFETFEKRRLFLGDFALHGESGQLMFITSMKKHNIYSYCGE